MSCKICNRPVKKGVYCERHGEAYANLEDAYQQWRYALGVSWIEYLDKVDKVSGSGRWVKEVIEDILTGE